ncbi:MAG TPA: hypothetical protein VHJ20_12135 [Polyangia bacterium]|nr:hypothetical protein [Polyangia bacterium]
MTTGAVPPAPNAAPEAPARKRPGWLTATAIGAIVLGAFKLMGTVSSFTMRNVVAATQRFGARNPAGRAGELQREMYETIADLSNRYLADHFVLILAGGIVGAFVIVAGVGCYRLKLRARVALLAGFVALVACDAALAPAEVRYQIAISDANLSYMTNLMDEASDPPNPFTTSMTSFTKITARTGVVVNVCFLALRVLASGAGAVYLASASVKRVFEAPPG